MSPSESTRGPSLGPDDTADDVRRVRDESWQPGKQTSDSHGRIGMRLAKAAATLADKSELADALSAEMVAPEKWRRE